MSDKPEMIEEDALPISPQPKYELRARTPSTDHLTVAANKEDPQTDRVADDGHFNQYGMRADPRELPTSNSENPGTGEGPRRFGGGGDSQTYENRDSAVKRTEDTHGPMGQVSAGGSARALGLDYGGEQHKEEPLSSRQGAELINEKRGNSSGNP